jgi:putative hemolysin
MKKQAYFWIILALIILVIICVGAYLFFQDNNEDNAQIANPASVYCINQSGTLEIRTAQDGSQTGYCIFKNGKECEEWQFFRGECKNE